MSLLLLPDFLAITLLVFVLFRLRDQRHDGTIRIWTLGLLLIVLESLARMVYVMQTPAYVHRLSHVVALASYCVAGAVFIYSASQGLRLRRHGKLLLTLNTAPLLLLVMLYGLQAESAISYYAVAAAGVVVGVGAPFALKRPAALNIAFAVVWLPLIAFLTRADYRGATYLALGFLYGMAALYFARSLPQGSQGKLAVVAGFALWATCFLTHPWLATRQHEWELAAGYLWDMQKFVITVGLLVVLLEDQVRSNEWLALHDDLTGLPNRRLFEDRLQHALLNADRTKGRLALFAMDLNGFKQVNDTLGHDAGDLLLKGISQNLAGALRRSDTLARLGGDEFSLIAADLDGASGRPIHHGGASSMCAASAMPQVQRILNAMSRAAETPICLGEAYNDRSVRVSASIGVAIYPDEATSQEDLLRLADQRMYAGKAARGTRGSQQTPANYDQFNLQNV